MDVLNDNFSTDISFRKRLAVEAFNKSSDYDSKIFSYLNGKDIKRELRYGENPHQKARFIGDFDECFEQINGKDISYNNLLDIDLSLIHI